MLSEIQTMRDTHYGSVNVAKHSIDLLYEFVQPVHFAPYRPGRMIGCL